MNHIQKYLLTGILALSVAAAPVLTSLAAWAAPAGQEQSWYPETEHSDLDYSEMTYDGYDINILNEALNEFEALTSKEAEEVRENRVVESYNRLLDELDSLFTQFCLLQVLYYEDVSNTALSEDMETMELQINKYADRALLAVQSALAGACGGILRGQMTDAQLEYVRDYEAMTPRELELAAEEIRLVQQYDQAMMQEYEAVFEGETWTMDKLEEVNPEDAELYYSILAAILREENKAVGPVFQELVQVRTEIARENGYDNYADYAYEEVYNRDYTTEEIWEIGETIQKKISPLYAQASLLFYTMGSDDEAFNTAVPGEEILDTIEPYIPQIHPSLAEAFDYMRRHHLYNIEASDSKMDMAFTTSFYSYKAPFIFSNPYGSSQDYWTLIHEYGHYNAMYHSAERALYEESTLDVAEIHSQGMEVLFFEYMDDIFGENGKVMEMNSILNMLYAITEGFKYDRFQQTVYKNPDMTLNEINRLAAELELSFSNLNVFDADDENNPYRYYWVEITHTFQSPMYYISYATSALSALDIWGLSMTDREDAVEKYMELSAMGFAVPYKKALETAGLRDMLDKENIYALSGEIYTALKDMNSAAAPEAPEAAPAETDKEESEAIPYAGFFILFLLCAGAGFASAKIILKKKPNA